MKRQRKQDTGFVSSFSWGSEGQSDGQFDRPLGIAIGMDDLIYVSDTLNNRVQCFWPNGTFLRKWGRKGRGDGEFNAPCGLAITACNGMKEEITSALGEVVELSLFPPGLLPICVAYIGDECVVIAETQNQRIQICGTDGKFVHKWSCGSNVNQPRRCFVDMNGLVYVSYAGLDYYISVFGLNGMFIRQLRVILYCNVSVSRTGCLYVASANDDEIICYDSDGRIIRVLTSEHFHFPTALLVNDDETLYVYTEKADYSDRVFQFGCDGTFLRDWKCRKDDDCELVSSIAMAKSSNGALYLVDPVCHRIVVMKLPS